MTKTFIQIDATEVDAALVSKPTNRTFREAWCLEGDVINVDMAKARDIQREKVRSDRTPIFEKLDADFMKALEQGQDTSAIALQKQKLRDMPSDMRIETASSPEELQALTVEFLLNN